MTSAGRDDAMGMPLSDLVALYVLDRVDAHELPKHALDFVLAGMDSQWMAALAGAERSEVAYELRDVFERALRELVVALPTRVEAIFTVRNRLARQVVSGALSPRDGGWALYVLDCETEGEFPRLLGVVGAPLGLSAILGAYWQHDGVDEDDVVAHETLDAEILEACEVLVAATKSNRLWQPQLSLSRTWESVAKHYREPWKRTPALDALVSLCDHVARAPYCGLLFCTTSMHDLLVAQHREVDWGTGILRIAPADQTLRFVLHEQPFVTPKPFTVAPADLINSFEKFLRKTKWLSESAFERAKRE